MPASAVTSTSPWLWAGFGALVLGMLALDLGAFHRRAHAITKREAFAWSAIWISLALIFNAIIYWQKGAAPAGEFLAAWIVEKSLSVDNLFVFLVIFNYFALAPTYQHRVLFWGILGALLMRALFIAAGTVLLAVFHWVMYVFGAFLVFTGIKLCLAEEKEPDLEHHLVIRLARRLFRITDDFEAGSFFVRRDGRRWATPLLVVLLVIEVSDIMFAVDSVPAVLAISADPFIVYTSNIFAILGLRALYFLLAGIIEQFLFLRYGLAVILAFVGTKMLIADVYKIPIATSLGVIVGVLVVTMLVSVAVARRREAAAALAPTPPSPPPPVKPKLPV